MIWVKVDELIEKNNDFQMISKLKYGDILWCLIRKGVPMFYQKKELNTPPFCNVFCLFEIHENITESSPIRILAMGIDSTVNVL